MLVFLVVMTLATMIAPRGLDRIDQAKRMKAQLDLRALAEALEHYVIDTGDYPTTEEGLQALYVCPSMTVGWRGPYLQGRLKRDPWGRDYVYLYPGRYADLGSAFDLVSYGRDGREGGESHDADVSNFEVYLASVEP
jgi:general secretion pathway protein G